MNENQNTSATAAGSRPPLTADLTGAELLRWYWTLDELTGLARSMGVARHGGKAALTARLAAALDGLPLPAAAARRRPATAQLEQFEFNRFTSAWHRGNPAGTRAQALEAWYAHRALPKPPSGG
ncbi:hypothetical protein [Streptomyces sp. NPDC017958]|uniref:hypothetical protein n=1 Tax=Streptomyces sp. NPDC017958 TaxID=3365021 RepID=UPI0037B51094